ncbi:MAG: NAD(P)H-dependent oxidoreductase [Pigmentiphaga sp.]
MRVLIVYAHPEPKSFGHALLERSLHTLRSCGHEVMVSDLYAMGFNPVATGVDFSERRFPDALQYDREQKQASQRHTFAADIQEEIDKLMACDLLILQFPLWWFSVPAILKGWIDRVFVNGTVYGAGGRRFDQGGLKGRKAMLAFTTGCFSEMMTSEGLLGHRDVILWHLQYGTFGYSGLQVLQPFVGWAIQYSDETRRGEYLDLYEARLRTIEHEDTIAAHRLAEFGPDWCLLPEVDPRTVGHWRR